jgi:RND family efflux transporter MFP subunit
MRWLTLGVLALAGLTGVNGCGGRGSAEEAPAETPPVLVGVENLFVAETDTLRNGPSVSGTLVAEREATVRAEVQGIVLEVAVEDGQRVARGQLLGRITDDAVRDQVVSAQSAVRTANEAFVVAQRNAERAEKLAKAGALADRELEQARWSVTNAEGALADARARLASAEKQWAQTQLRAPIAGIVSERHVNAGDVAQQGTALFTVVDPRSLRLEAQIPVAALEALRLGTPVPFAVDGYGDRQFEGRVIRINPAVDPATRQVRVTVALPNQGGQLVAGLFAQGRAAVELRAGIVVPTSAIDRRGIRPTVTRVKSGLAERVEVTVGIEDPTSDRVEITSGLAEGDTVIIGSARGIQPGTRVRPSAPAERAGGGGGGGGGGGS